MVIGDHNASKYCNYVSSKQTMPRRAKSSSQTRLLHFPTGIGCTRTLLVTPAISEVRHVLRQTKTTDTVQDPRGMCKCKCDCVSCLHTAAAQQTVAKQPRETARSFATTGRECGSLRVSSLTKDTHAVRYVELNVWQIRLRCGGGMRIQRRARVE